MKNVVLVGKGKNSTQVLDFFSRCPYKVSCVSCGEYLWSLFKLPEDHIWWLEEITREPSVTIGLEEAEIFLSTQLSGESEFSKGEAKPVLEVSPCGTNCASCPLYVTKCEGCPSTVHYTGSP